MQTKHFKNRGFTLVEVLVALVLLLIMSLGTLYGLSKTMSFVSQNQYKEQAKQVAQARMDELLEMPYDVLQDRVMPNETEEAGPTYLRFFGESSKEFRITENIYQKFPNAIRISITVHWKQFKDTPEEDEETFTLTSIRGKR